jgi:YidC/Oxa1 family membrane protein insertase
MLWSNMIDVVRGGLFVLAGAFGGSWGAAIFIASAAMRIAVLPITLASARRRLVRERALLQLAPQLDAIKKLYAKRRDVLLVKTRELYAANGINAVDPKDLVGSLLQYPPAAALYSAIRSSSYAAAAGPFLWISSLAKPDRWLALVAALVSAIVVRASMIAIPQGGGTPQVVSVVLGAAITFAILSHVGAGLALYSVANSVITGAERMIAKQTMKTVTA